MVGSISQLNDMPIISLAVVGNIYQNPAGPIGVHNGSLPWEVTVGGLLQEVYHGSFPWEFTALTYFEALYLFWVIDILRTLNVYHSLSMFTIGFC